MACTRCRSGGAARLAAVWSCAASVAAAAVLQRSSQNLLQRYVRAEEPANALQITRDYPFYHTSAQLADELRRLAADCPAARFSLDTATEGDVALDVVRVRQGHAEKPNKVFVVSGEHAREVIGPESTIRLLQELCGDSKATNTRKAEKALEDAEFLVVVNANPGSRAKVDAGGYCVRANPSGVDLNRNWDEQWAEQYDVNQGTKPFSEPETRILKRLLEKFKPTTFLSIHSGTAGMYMPWAWSTNSLAGRNQPAMMQVLRAVDATHCRCPFGAAGKEVGYPCPGTSVDYVYEKLGAAFSYAFEIWGAVDMQAMHQRWQAKADDGGLSLLMTGASLAHPHFKDVFHEYPSEFIQTNASIKSDALWDEAGVDCFPLFNPESEEVFAKVVDNWADAYLEVTSNVSALIKEGKISNDV